MFSNVLKMPFRFTARSVRRLTPRRLRSATTVGMCVALLCGLDGGRGGHQAVAAHRPIRAWFDAKGLCVFPMGVGRLPASRDQLIDSLTAGWKRGLKFPEPDARIVSVEGSHYPAMAALRFDLANGRMDPTKENKNTKPNGTIEGHVVASQFELDGRPLLCEKAQMSLHLTASQARLDFQHDEAGRPILMLADARRARMDFEATRSDLERILLISAREAGKKYAISVEKLELKLDTPTPHRVDVDLHLSTKVGFIPAGMHFQAHLDIDAEMNGTLTHLKCEGDEALGPLIVGIIRPGLAKYEGKSKPVFSFPAGDLKLKDVQITGGDDVKVMAAFGL